MKRSETSRRHFIRFGRVERIARCGELIRHHVAEIHEIIEPFLESIGCSGII